jgi:hypothetical protein
MKRIFTLLVVVLASASLFSQYLDDSWTVLEDPPGWQANICSFDDFTQIVETDSLIRGYDGFVEFIEDEETGVAMQFSILDNGEFAEFEIALSLDTMKTIPVTEGTFDFKFQLKSADLYSFDPNYENFYYIEMALIGKNGWIELPFIATQEEWVNLDEDAIAAGEWQEVTVTATVSAADEVTGLYFAPVNVNNLVIKDITLGEVEVLSCSTILPVESYEAISSISLFPNPASGEFYMNDDAEMVSVFNATGQKVISVDNYRNGQPISIQSLASGLYFVTDGKFTGKLMVE